MNCGALQGAHVSRCAPLVATVHCPRLRVAMHRLATTFAAEIVGCYLRRFYFHFCFHSLHGGHLQPSALSGSERS